MIDSTDPFFMALAAVMLAVFILVQRRKASLHRAEALKYRLYKVRDDMIYLRLSGQLEENDIVYRFFYSAADSALNMIDHIHLKNFVMALESIRRDGIDPAEARNVEAIEASLQSKDPEVREAVDGFYRAIIEILWAKSLQLQILTHLIAADMPVKPIVRGLEKLGDAVRAVPVTHNKRHGKTAAAGRPEAGSRSTDTGAARPLRDVQAGRDASGAEHVELGSAQAEGCGRGRVIRLRGRSGRCRFHE